MLLLSRIMFRGPPSAGDFRANVSSTRCSAPGSQSSLSRRKNELKEHILKLESMFFGLTPRDVRTLAFQYAELNGIPHSFSGGMAGKDWLRGLLKRHKDLSLRSPEATSAARASGFNRPAVDAFFANLETAMDGIKGPHRVYNVDETGITTVQAKPSKVITKRGKRQIGSITSAERGELATAVVCMSAGGNFVPPLIILPRTRVNKNLEEGAPPGTVFQYHQSGWMQMSIFKTWIEHFIAHTKPSAEDPVLLILDGHLTHTRNLEAIELARKNHVTLLVIPPHTSHRLQPLDVSFMGPLSTFYTQAVEKFLRQNPGRVVTVYQLARLFGEAYLKAASQTTAINGFKKCGISPVDKDVFSGQDFAPAQPTDRPQPDDQIEGDLHGGQVRTAEEQVAPVETSEPQKSSQRSPKEGRASGGEEEDGSVSSTSESEDDGAGSLAVKAIGAKTVPEGTQETRNCHTNQLSLQEEAVRQPGRTEKTPRRRRRRQ